EHGRAVYTRRCVGCHGRDGDGNGEAATFLSPRPRDFTAAIFKFRSTPSGSLPTDADLFRTATRGVRGTAMPTWHELPMEDRRAVIAFIKTFSPRWRDEKPEPGGLPASPPPASTALIERGRDVYRSAKCWECRRARPRRWAVGRTAQRRLRVSDPTDGFHAWSVQGGRHGRRHLPRADRRPR